MSSAWEVRDLLPGPTFHQYAGYGLIALGASAAGGLCAIVWTLTVIVRTQALDPVIVTAMTVCIGGWTLVMVLKPVSNRKEKAEILAGYTTSAQGNNEVARLHSPTGVVMRNAGEPDLTKPQWEVAMTRVRAYQESLGRTSQ